MSDLCDNLLRMLPQPSNEVEEENGNVGRKAAVESNSQMILMQKMLAEQAAKMREMEEAQKKKELDLEREREERRKR